MLPAAAKFFPPGFLPSGTRAWFPPEFLTGCNVDFVLTARAHDNVSITGYLEEHIMNFEWGVSQAKRPVYGYASYLWDRVATGTQIVSGQFAIPYTRKFRIFEAIQKATDEMFKPSSNEGFFDAKAAAWEVLPLKDKVKAIKDGDINGSLMETAIDTLVGNKVGEVSVPKNDFFGVGPEGIDILIYYGNAESKTQNAFDAIKELRDSVSLSPERRVLTVKQVHISQNTQVIRAQGIPVLETYQFIARNVE